ncbi:MAG: hypothetical protein LBT86_02550 [Deltaproteobacteria bacterium]|nr:hypothetical protein [Deltaproteobacteria bacterium]
MSQKKAFKCFWAAANNGMKGMKGMKGMRRTRFDLYSRYDHGEDGEKSRDQNNVELKLNLKSSNYEGEGLLITK